MYYIKQSSSQQLACWEPVVTVLSQQFTGLQTSYDFGIYVALKEITKRNKSRKILTTSVLVTIWEQKRAVYIQQTDILSLLLVNIYLYYS